MCDNLTYSMLHEMIMKKFNLEANCRVNLSVKLSSFDNTFDITDDAEDVQPDAYYKLCQAGPQRWSRVHCPLVRYNYMTSNSIEPVNACTVLKRKLPVTMLAEMYHAMVQDWYFNRRELAANMTYKINDWVANKVHKRKLKSATWIVHGVNQYQYQVLDGGYNHEVNFETSTYECRKWQVLGISCGHVIAVTRLTIIMALQEAHDEEACLKEHILSLMHCFADKSTNCRPEINRLMTLPDHPLIDYGRYALERMTGADMRNASYLKMARDELSRSMKEKREFIKNYKEM
nr:transposase, MuDR, MULE transposase domain protein [Tanacetum cinerariifolium]